VGTQLKIDRTPYIQQVAELERLAVCFPPMKNIPASQIENSGLKCSDDIYVSFDRLSENNGSHHFLAYRLLLFVL
jgi:hypothetical protein